MHLSPKLLNSWTHVRWWSSSCWSLVNTWLCHPPTTPRRQPLSFCSSTPNQRPRASMHTLSILCFSTRNDKYESLKMYLHGICPTLLVFYINKEKSNTVIRSGLSFVFPHSENSGYHSQEPVEKVCKIIYNIVKLLVFILFWHYITSSYFNVH